MERLARSGKLAWCVGVLTLVAVGASPRLHAATATNNLTVTANVIASCSVTAGTLAFGNYDPTGAGNLDQNGTFTVACTKGTTATVGLDNGGNFATNRRMTNGTDFLAYELYQETGRSTVWGNTAGTWVSIGPAASNTPQTMTVYGRVTPGQNVGVGGYTDTVLITVTF